MKQHKSEILNMQIAQNCTFVQIVQCLHNLVSKEGVRSLDYSDTIVLNGM